MNRDYLLDSLDGLKGLVFRLLPSEVFASIGCVPMTTDGLWTDEEKTVFETAIGIPHERVYWTPGGFGSVPSATDRDARSRWVYAVAAINQKYLFLDPDIGFYTHHTGASEKMVLVNELKEMLRRREALIIYRHQYFPNPRPRNIAGYLSPYVCQSLRILEDAGFARFAYQSQAASLFFVAKQEAALAPLRNGLQRVFSGVSASVVERRIVA